MTELAQKVCTACKEGAPRVTEEEIAEYKKEISTEWKVVGDHHLERKLTFPDFKKTLEFVNKVGEVAEKEGHHPNIDFTWGKCKITLYTHKIDGLHENDFILAAKIDEIL